MSYVSSEKINTLRTQAIVQTENVSKKSRFGLFTHPPPIAVGNPYLDKEHNYRATTTIPSVKSNIKIEPLKEGKTDEVLFSKPKYITIDDAYFDKYKMEVAEEVNKNAKLKGKVPFRPNDINKTKIEASYPYINEDYVDGTEARSLFNHKKREGNDGKSTHTFHENPAENRRAKTATKSCKNFLVGPGLPHRNKTFNHLFGLYPHMVDEFDNAQRKDRTELVVHKSKILSAPFKLNNYGKGTFSSPRVTYHNVEGSTGDNVMFLKTRTAERWIPNNPAKIGFNKTLSKFPQYMPDPPNDELKIIKEENIWKPNFNGTLAKPCPPLNQFKRNKKTFFHQKISLPDSKNMKINQILSIS